MRETTYKMCVYYTTYICAKQHTTCVCIILHMYVQGNIQHVCILHYMCMYEATYRYVAKASDVLAMSWNDDRAASINTLEEVLLNLFVF